jgi:hypothetical protein
MQGFPTGSLRVGGESWNSHSTLYTIYCTVHSNIEIVNVGRVACTLNLIMLIINVDICFIIVLEKFLEMNMISKPF